MDIQHKLFVKKAGGDPLEFVMSDETVDRMGDIIEAKGWKLENFKKNPIALFAHDSRFVIGHWESVKVVGKQLIGKLAPIRKGISERLDEVLVAIEEDILRAVSVGFHPIEAEAMDDGTGGVRFKKHELVECSVVSVPANPNALRKAAELNLSDDVQEMIFGKSAVEIAALRRGSGKSATVTKTHSNPGKNKMKTLAERITDAQNELVALKDQLTEHTKSDDMDENVVEELSNKIEAKQAQLASLERAEKALAPVEGSDPIVLEGKANDLGTRDKVPAFAKPPKIKAGDHMIRTMAVKLISHVEKRDPLQILEKMYGPDETTKMVFEHVQKAATAPATTTTSGWASQLVQTVNADFMETLMPDSVYPSLAARGLKLSFGRNGTISIPSRSATPTIAGSFVGEGAPIPVRQGAFTSTSLTPKKMAVISAFTREIATHSVPAIEGLIRDAIREDTSVAIDTVLLDATAASAIRPAGLRNGVAVTTATAGADMAALKTDIKALVAGLITTTNGNLRNPVWIMNPLQALSISMIENAGGDTPFAADISAGRFTGYPLILSPTVTAGMVILVDAADFVSVSGDDPMFDVSDQATIHMEDTTPLAIGTAGAPATVAAPVRSLWQTDSLALRMILPMNWALRRAGVVEWTEAVTW